jgi:hypothetical protein
VKSIKTQAKKGGVHTLSNDDLRALNNRMNLEVKYNQLNKNPYATKARKGHDVAKEILAVAGTAATVYTLAHSPMGQAVGKAIATGVVTKGRHAA